MRFGTYIDLARSTIIREVAELPYDYILFLDHDVVFTPTMLCQLEAAYDPEKMGAISGSYCYRDGSGRTTFGWKNEDGSFLNERDATLKALKHSETGDVVPVDKMPGGFLLIASRIARKLPSPAFACQWVEGQLEDGTKVAHFIGEDSYFVQMLQAHGYEPCGHFGVQLGHMGKVPLGLTGVTLEPMSQQQVT
jgi:hypothetical protein